MARPRKMADKDYDDITRLAELGLSVEAVCNFMGILSKQTAYNDPLFLDYYKKGYREVGAKVRLKVLENAEKGDITSAIYLDKVINKSSEKNHDDNIELKRDTLELEKQKAKDLADKPFVFELKGV